ncbi:DUF192 domain-containing protein [Acidithiobacillus sp. IBUN Pt1247-S3]|uniref:DUF192 domain-containing protein n=1 Tax=Acidithiobacillus sp. IBUN Pt1247-S3 TaxID=3166642 RepID=UPI0034E58D67
MRTSIAITRNREILWSQANIASSFFQRLRGLLLRPPLQAQEGLLIPHCNAVHMWGMRHAIDLVWLDGDGIIVGLQAELRPWAFARCARARSALELAPSSIARQRLQIGQQLHWVAAHSPGQAQQIVATPEAGAGAVEFLIAAPAVLLLFLGTLQTSLLYQARLQLEVATQDAARAGALHGGSLDAIRDGLARGLAPLYTHGQGAGDYAEGYARAKLAAAQAQIDILNPTREAVQDFKEAGRLPLDDATGQKQGRDGNWGWGIPENHLGYRSTQIGSNGQLRLQDANLLKIRVTYHQPLIMPFVDRLFARFDPNNQHKGSVVGGNRGGNGAIEGPQGALDRLLNTFPLRAEATFRMQTPFTAFGNTADAAKLQAPQPGGKEHYDPEATTPSAPLPPLDDPDHQIDEYDPRLKPPPDFSNAC